MRVRLGAVIIAGAFLLVGCASKATGSECASACDNVTKLYLGEVEAQTKTNEELKALGSTGLDEARAMANIQLEYLRQECERECNSNATRKDAECLVAAKTKADLDLCQ